MKIILSQRIDIESNYDDMPFVTYHFPKRYRNQIKSGCRFIYYQGNRHKKEHRYYFGCGVIGAIETGDHGESYYAEIIEGYRFLNTVPIYSPSGQGFLESLGYEKVRNKPNPSWQNSIRKISDEAFFEVLKLANVKSNLGENASLLEISGDSLGVLKLLNNQYRGLEPKGRKKLIQQQLDRGSSISKALKRLLGARCQICGWEGFEKVDAESYIEAHHITQLAERRSGSLCTENIILLCPNCHKEVHYGKNFSVKDNGDTIKIVLSKYQAEIKKNTIEHLSMFN